MHRAQPIMAALLMEADIVGCASWRLRAKCAGQCLGSFFPPPEGERPHERKLREAVARGICRGCPVVQPCLDLAKELGEPPGVWGGLNERERSRLRTRRG